MFLAISNILGVPQITVQQTTADWLKFLGRDGQSGTPPMMRPGTRIVAYDDVYGEAEFVLAYGVASLAIGDMVRIGAGYATTRTVAATRGTLAVSMSANTDTTALSWFCVRGMVPGTVATHTVDTVSYLTATAGSVSSTDGGAGYAIVGCSSVLAAGGTVDTKTISTVNGSVYITCPDLDGLYVGMAVTGTGVGASAVISAINEGGKFLGSPGISGAAAAGNVQLSVASTATGSVTGTFAHPSTKATLFLNHPQAAGTVD